MKVALVQQASFSMAYGGAHLSNESLFAELYRMRHSLMVLARAEAGVGDLASTHNGQMSSIGLNHKSICANRRISFRVVTPGIQMVFEYIEAILMFRPDLVVLQADEKGFYVSSQIIKACKGRVPVMFLIRMSLGHRLAGLRPQDRLPYLKMIADCDLSVAVSQAVAEEAKVLGLRNVEHIPISSLAKSMLKVRFTSKDDRKYVLAVNRCPEKGFDVLVRLCSSMPHVQFKIVKGWGTQLTHIAALAAYPNVTIEHFTEDMNSIYDRSSITLVPSLWFEGRSRVVSESWARGVPVVASRIGGIPEAMFGLPFLIDVPEEARIVHHASPPIINSKWVNEWQTSITRL